MRLTPPKAILLSLVVSWSSGWANPAKAHCDGLDGPVVTAARKALEARDVRPVLIWIQEKDEPEIRTAFEKTLAVRKLGPEARDLADMYFFETLVRIHRAGEGAPYTGLKPAGRDLGPAIPAADRAIVEGSPALLARLLVEAVEHGLHKRFDRLIAVKRWPADNVKAGREYVKAYVDLMHYVERIYEAAAGPVSSHDHVDAEPARNSHEGHQ